MEKLPKNIPTVFIIFGATGDLMSKKIAPALFHLYVNRKFPNLFKIIAFSRRDLTLEKFQDHIRQIFHSHKDKRFNKNEIESFLKYFEYQKGDFGTSKAYDTMAKYLGRIDGEWMACSNKLFYLAVPPLYYESIFKNLASSGLTIPCGPGQGWTRIIVEKPFGKNAETAQQLDELLGRLFKEDQIYRIDHFLGKEMLQNILSFRFSNDLFEKTWNNEHIEKIEIRVLEDIGLEGRTEFYDGTGALRDVGQNHMLQMLAIATMEQPTALVAEEVRKKRAQILEKLIPPTVDDVRKHTFRGQLASYKSQKGVLLNSTTETYFKVIGFLDSKRWKGIPIVLESGKSLEQRKEIIFTYKHKIPCLCPAGVHYKNRVIFSLDPKEGITIEFWSKKPGLTFEMEQQKLSFLFRDQRKKVQYVEEYEKLLLDCIAGNQLLFVSTEEVKAMWEFIDPIISGWEKNIVPLHIYKPKSKKISQDSSIIVEQI